MKQIDPSQLQGSETDMLLAEKDSKIEELCNQLAESRYFQSDIQKAHLLMNDLRDQGAAEQEKFERSIQSLEEKYETSCEWFNHKMQELEMTLQAVQDELRMIEQSLKDS